MAQVDIDGIKAAIKSLLDTANTTTGSPIDLSQGLATRVQRVMMLNPTRIPIQPSWFPYVTIYATSKDPIEPQTLGHRGNQSSALRTATLNLDVFGCVFEPNVTNANEDQACENIEQLMENVEEVLRSSSDLNSTCNWAFPSRVQYDDLRYDEESSLRCGILELQCTIYY